MRVDSAGRFKIPVIWNPISFVFLRPKISRKRFFTLRKNIFLSRPQKIYTKTLGGGGAGGAGSAPSSGAASSGAGGAGARRAVGDWWWLRWMESFLLRINNLKRIKR